MFKSLLIFIFLVIWTALADSTSCIVFAIYILGITTLLTIALSETKIINKYVIAERVFHNTTSLFRIVKSAWATLLLSSLIAFYGSTVLLLQSIYIDPVLFLVLGIDVVLIRIVHDKIKNKLSLTVKTPFLDAVARRVATWFNTVLLIVIFVLYQFFTTPTTEIQVISCEVLDFLSSTLRYKELIEWKLVSSSIYSLDHNYSLYSWILYLFITQGVFAWAYSKLLLSVDISMTIIKSDNSVQTKNYFILGFVGAILLLLVSTLIINHLYEKDHMQAIEKKVQKAYLTIDTTINKQLRSSEHKILDSIDQTIDKQIDIAFEPVYQGIPRLSDYYYSVKGEYTRIVLKGHDLWCGYKNGRLVPYNKFLPNWFKLKKCNDKMLNDEIQSKINRYLFIDSNFNMHSNKASINVNRSIEGHLNSLKNELQRSLKSFGEKENISKDEQIQARLDNINAKFDEIFEASARDMAKKSLSGTGAILLTSSISKTIMSKMLLKLGAKGAGKAASFAAGSATGLTVCAPTGPWALLCGVVTGTASWIGVDAAMTEIDQAFNEDDFQISVRKMIDSEKRTLKTLMKASYHKWILNVFKELEESPNSLNSPYKQLQNQ